MFKSKLSKLESLKNISVLLSGSVFAQLILLAATPVLTRIYSPSDFGILAIFIALVSIIGIIANGRYEIAITQAESEDDSLALVVLAIIFSVFIAVLSFVLVIIFESKILDYFSGNDIKRWLYLLPLSVLLMGFFQSFNYWNNRQKKYTNISIAKINQSLSNVGANLTLYKVQITGYGLLMGFIFGQIILAISLIYKTKLSLHKFRVKKEAIKKVALRYIKFPLYSMPGALFNSLALQLPVLFIARIYDSTSVGFFHFIIRIIGGPLSLISFSISQILLQKLSADSYEDISKFIKSTLLILTSFALLFILVIYFFGEPLIKFIFGDEWGGAGVYAQILVFSIGVRFVVSPLSVVLALDKFIHIGVSWQLYSFFSVLIVSLATAHLPLVDFLKFFVLQDILSYSLYLWLILSASKKIERP